MVCLLVVVAVQGYKVVNIASEGFSAYRAEARTSVAANGADALTRSAQDRLSRFRLDVAQEHIKATRDFVDRAINYYLADAKKWETDPQEVAVLNKQIDRLRQFEKLVDEMQQRLTEGTRLADTEMAALGPVDTILLSEI